MSRAATRRQALGAIVALCSTARARAEGGRKSVTIELGQYDSEEESTVWLSYALGLANWATSSGVLEQAPLGPLVPSFEGELAARQTLIIIWRELQEKKNGKPLPYMDALLRVEAAGFLREYVWTVHWRSSWKAQPADLRIAEFYAWQRKELVGHEPQTRSRVRVVEAPPAKP